MASYSFRGFPEVFTTRAEHTAIVTSGLKERQIRRIRRGLYTTNLSDPLEVVVKRNLWPIVALLAPGGVISHRTALEGRPSPSNVVVITGDYRRTIEIPGLTLRQLKGPARLDGDAPFIDGLFMSSRARYYLECLSGKVYGNDSAFLSSEEIERHLEKVMLLGEGKLNEIRDLAKKIAPDLGMQPEFLRLDSIIGTLLGTKSARLTSKTALARAAGDPYDANRLELFQILLEEMNAWPATSRPDAATTGQAFQNIGFFDAYFSNFIEGSEFEVDEAIEIAFHNKIPSTRPEDAHDLLGTFRIVANADEMTKPVTGLSPTDFLSLLRSWHHTIMQGRPDKRPGDFKEIPNQAGRTLFVAPALTVGTLRRGFELSRGIHSAFGRAVFLMFAISEVHPFDDGNGRLARAVCNAELVAHHERRIIIPTVFRVEYIDSLRLLSREKQARTLARMADQAQEFSADVEFTDLAEARARLDAWHAFDTDADSRLRRPRN